jgi:hypothetical protein
MMIGALGSTWLGHHRQHPVPHGRLCREGPHSENAQSRARHQRCRTSASADRCPAAGRSRVSAPTGRSRICASTTARSPDATSSRSIEWSRLVGSVGHLPPGVPLDISCDSAVHRDAGCANRLRVSNAIAVGMLFITGSHTDALSASLPGWSASRWWDWGPRSPCDRREAVPWVHHLVLPLTARPLPQSSACRADDGLLLVLITRTSARSTSAPQEPDHSTARYDTSRHSPFTRRQTNTIVPPGRPSCTTCSTAP